MKVSRAAAATVAACLIVGLSAFAPSAAGAASKKDSAKAKSAQSAKTVNSRLNTTRRQLTTTRRNLTKLTTDLGALSRRLQSAEGGLGTILGAAPTLINGLQTLATAVQTQIAPGLQTLAAAVQTQIAPGLTTLGNAVRDQIVPGLTRAGDAILAEEYGVTKVFLGPGGAGGALPLGATSGDVPDDGNTATAAGQLPLSSGGAAGQVPAGTLLSLRSAIRSGETETADPAGYVGGLLTLVCAGGGAGGTCDADPTGGTTAVPAGTIVCAMGPAPAQNIPLPNGTTSSQGVVTITAKVDRLDQNRPAAGDVNPLQGATAGAANGPLANDAGDGCLMGDVGAYLLNFQTQFADPPTSLSPGPKD